MKSCSLTEGALAVEGRLIGPDDAGDRIASGYASDSRRVKPGDLFIALEGPNSDGHRYVESALRSGAVAALVSETWARHFASKERSDALIAVEDTLVALGKLAKRHASNLPARRVAITGSVGKTTTKEMTAAILEASGPTLKSEASQNGETGVPLALLQLTEAHRYAVLEMGMRGPGQIRYLAEIVRPEIGLITNIGRVHMEFLGSQEGIARAKGEMLELLPKEGKAILPSGDAYLPLLRNLAPCEVLTFGAEEKADVRLILKEKAVSSSLIEVSFPDGRSLEIRLPLPGLHNALDATGALALAWALDADVTAGQAILARFEPPSMRSQTIRTNRGITLLNDAYNANPDSMRAALGVLAEHPPRRIAVLGDMLELGDLQESEHEALGRDMVDCADVLVGVGPWTKATAKAAREAGLPEDSIHWFADSEEAAAALPALIQPGDTVLLKGSRVMRMEIAVSALTSEGEGE